MLTWLRTRAFLAGTLGLVIIVGVASGAASLPSEDRARLFGALSLMLAGGGLRQFGPGRPAPSTGGSASVELGYRSFGALQFGLEAGLAVPGARSRVRRLTTAAAVVRLPLDADQRLQPGLLLGQGCSLAADRQSGGSLHSRLQSTTLVGVYAEYQVTGSARVGTEWRFATSGPKAFRLSERSQFQELHLFGQLDLCRISAKH